ncbi:GldG family protein [Nitrospira sp. Nam80]
MALKIPNMRKIRLAPASLQVVRDAWRRRHGRRWAWRSANSVTILVLLAGLLVVVNGIAAYKDVRFDLSETRRFTLAPRTLDLLDHLDQEVKIYAFVQKGSGEEKTALELLETYRNHSSKLTVHVLDPEQHPTQAKEFDVNQFGTIVVMTARGRQARGTAVSEAEITRALLRAVREAGQAVYFLEGHGEHSLTEGGKDGYAQLRAILEHEGYTPKALLLLGGESIPADAPAVVIPGPKHALLETEVEQVQRYVERGGRLAVLTDPQVETGLEPLLARWGVTLGAGVVVDQEGRTFGGSATLPLITVYSVHEIVRDLKLPTLFPGARPLLLDLKSERTGLTYLAQTSGQSWAERDVGVRPVQFDPKREDQGPFTLAVAAAPRTMPSDPRGSPRMIIVGDSDYLTNTYLNFSGNRDLFLNMLNWLMQGLDSFTIRPPDVKVSPIILSEQQARVLFVLPVVALPLCIAAAGWTVSRYRRTRS